MIFRATKQHAINLARFVTLYKSVLLFQRLLNRGKQRSMDSFFAGLIGGCAVVVDVDADGEGTRFSAAATP